MTHLLRIDDQQGDLVMPGQTAAPDAALRDALALTEEARSDERAKRLAAEATAEQMATLIAQEHRYLGDERAARERAEADLADAEATLKQMAKLNERYKLRAEDAERRAAQAFCDDPNWPTTIQLTPRQRLLRALRIR